MLMIRGIDKVELHKSIPKKEDFYLLLSIHQDLAKLHGVKSGIITTGKKYGRRLKLNVSGTPLEVVVCRAYGTRWIEYKFNGAIDHEAFEKATEILGPFSFRWTAMTGSVKVLELSTDYVGLKSGDFIFHYVGVQTGVVWHNPNTGPTHYSGRPASFTQLVGYDKARELAAKNKLCPFPELLRIELKLLNRKEPLPQLIARLFLDDHFSKVIVVEAAVAAKYPSHIKEWPLFVSCCKDIGVAKALHNFTAHKKTFLKYLKSLSSPQFQSRVDQFRKQLTKIYPNPALWDAIDTHLAEI